MEIIPFLKDFAPFLQYIIPPFVYYVSRKLEVIGRLQRALFGEGTETPGLIKNVQNFMEKYEARLNKATEVDERMNGSIVELSVRLGKAEAEIENLRPIKHKYDSVSLALMNIQDELKYIRERLDTEVRNRERDV